MLNAMLKPFDSFKKEETNLSSFKNSGILVAIVVGILTIINLVTTMFNAVRVKGYLSDETKWGWENLKNIKYIKLIGQDILMYLGILCAISGVYFLAGLVMKKEIKFVKILSSTVTACLPIAVATAILSPLFSIFNNYIATVITVAGSVYSLMILLELLNDQIVIDNKNTRIYFHLVCISILIIGGSFIAYKLILGSMTSELGSLNSLFE